MTGFNLSLVLQATARAVPDAELVVWRDLRRTYAEVDRRADGLAHLFARHGLGCHTERFVAGEAEPRLAGHESGQDHVGLYLRNGPEYVEAMAGAGRARLAPYNVNFRYVEEELIYLLRDADTAALVYHAEFAPQVQAIRGHLDLRLLVQVADESGNALLEGAVDYEDAVATPAPETPLSDPSGDDLFIVYTGGTTGMPKGVLWRQDDMYVSSMGGTPFGSDTPFASYDEVAAAAAANPGAMTLVLIPPFMHAAAQWTTFHLITNGGRLVLPDDVHNYRPDQVLRLAEREGAISIPVVGDAIALPLVEEIERGDYDLSGLITINNGAAALTPAVRDRLTTALPHIMVMDAVGASETGIQMSQLAMAGGAADSGVFTPQADTAVVDETRERLLGPGESDGWLARRARVPLGYLGDEAKTLATFPVIDGVRWSVPGDRADVLDDGRIRLLGRESQTINSGGEKIFVEEVERAMAAHPAVRDVVVVGRPAPRWGQEVVAVVQLESGAQATDEELIAQCGQHVARYKLPRDIVRAPRIARSPAGKADYRWALALAEQPS